MADAKKVKINGIWYYVKDETARNGLAAKQDTLTFDTAPTASSTNPVTSGGVKTALDGKQDTLTFDTAPTASSTNPVTSGGVKTALDGKQDTLTFDTTPTANSTNPVTSGGVKTALDRKQNAIGSSIELIRGTASLSVGLNSSFELYLQQKNTAVGNSYDNYYFPKFDNSGDSNRVFNILTSKNVITTEQGGTGGTDSGWLSLKNASVFDGSIDYRRIGKFVYVTGQSVKLKNALTTSSVTLGVMPNGYRPGKWSAFWAGRPSDAGYEAGMIVFTASGNIEFNKPASISQWNAGAMFYFSFMYMTS